jgi:hypothetical protein
VGHLANPDASTGENGVPFVGAVLFEKHAKQLISRGRDDQKDAAKYPDHKHPAQDVSQNANQGIKHFHAPIHIGAFYRNSLWVKAKIGALGVHGGFGLGK